MDDLLRRRERAALTGDPEAVTAFARELLRSGEDLEVRRLLHPRVKKHPQDRFLFLRVMPENTAAFCGLCGMRFVLNDEGYPLSDKRDEKGLLPKKRRVAKKKKRCARCMDQERRASYHGHPLADRYCLFCGVTVRNSAHRCVELLPEWASGKESGEVVQVLDRPTTPHWTEWRRY